MTIHKHDGADFQLITEIQYTDDTLTDRNITEVWYNTEGVWVRVFETAAIDEVALDDKTVVSSRDTSSGLASVTAGFNLTTDGILTQTKNTTSFTDSTTETDIAGDNWWTGKPSVAIGSLYQVMVTVTSSSGGASLSGTIGAWTTISSKQSWALQESGNNVESISSQALLVQIRDVATSTVQDTSTITLSTLLFGP